MIVGRRHISNITGFEENSDSSDFTCSQLDQFVQNQVNLAFFNQCYLANVMVLLCKVYQAQGSRVFLFQFYILKQGEMEIETDEVKCVDQSVKQHQGLLRMEASRRYSALYKNKPS